jgi:hypothetical protein
MHAPGFGSGLGATALLWSSALGLGVLSDPFFPLCLGVAHQGLREGNQCNPLLQWHLVQRACHGESGR